MPPYHHERAAVAAEGVLQQAGELGVAVRHVPARRAPLVVAQRADHVAQCQQPRGVGTDA